MTPAIDIANAVNWDHPLNLAVKRPGWTGSWWCSAAGFGGGQWRDLYRTANLTTVGRLDASYRGVYGEPTGNYLTTGTDWYGSYSATTAFLIAMLCTPQVVNLSGNIELIGKETSSFSFDGWLVRITGGAIRLSCNGTSAVDLDGPSIPLGRPVHLAALASGKPDTEPMRIWVNGALKSSSSSPVGTINAETNPITLSAAYGPIGPTVGGGAAIYSARVWRLPLTNATLAQSLVQQDCGLAYRGYIGHDSPLRWLGGVSTLTGPRR